MTAPRRFYDDLAAHYHLLFADWDQAVLRQGEVLDKRIRARGGRVGTLLDATCGIGTQALGLAMRGWRVTATDLSPNAVDRMLHEAARLGVSVDAAVADLRDLAALPGTFDVVLSADNALPHFLDDADLGRALSAVRKKLAPGGLFLATIRDYDALGDDRPRFQSERAFPGRIVLQTWDWHGRTYTLHQFVLLEEDGSWRTLHWQTEYRALHRDELTRLLVAAGFVDIVWEMPLETGYYQPMVTARA